MNEGQADSLINALERIAAALEEQKNYQTESLRLMRRQLELNEMTTALLMGESKPRLTA